MLRYDATSNLHIPTLQFYLNVFKIINFRLLLTECDPEVCPAGKRCNNQRFEKREYPPLLPYKTQGRGWGLKTLAPIKKGQFVIEYVGEMIDEQEYLRRIRKMHEQKEENYYFLTIDKDHMLDAGPKGIKQD